MMKTAPYGSWKSPISSQMVSSKTIRLSQIEIEGEEIYWNELRPSEGGRHVIVRYTTEGETIEITSPQFNVRTRVHEYGGGAYIVDQGKIYFSNFANQRLYNQSPGKEPRPITPESKKRFADGIVDQYRDRIICVCEDHGTAGNEPVNSIVSIDLLEDNKVVELESGKDFYSSPRLSPDGSKLAWLSWNHPNMPWDGTELWVGKLNEGGSMVEINRVTGGVDESVFQPSWSPDGILYFVSDLTGWWNLYRWVDGDIEQLVNMKAEFGKPQWVFGMSTYDFESNDRIICSYSQKGLWHLASLDLRTGRLEPLDISYSHIASVKASDGKAVFLGGSATEPMGVVRLDLTSGEHEVLRRSTEIALSQGYLSLPEAIDFPSKHGDSAHGFYYGPYNKEYKGPDSEKPPLMVISHGGPTSATSSTFDPAIQYWTSRGFAVLDVNYGGSTGYGRDYRKRLEGKWGIVDIDDCVDGATYLVKQDKVDGKRLIIRGGSAGGYTTLAAICFKDTFKAGASYYGVSDLEALAKETHKFESRYLDRLIGPYPEKQDIYRKRSPINYTHKLGSPIIFFQGLEDEVVPPEQAEQMVRALREKKVPVAYITFEGEQHGFRVAENKKRALDAELYFYSKIFNFQLADAVEPVKIEHL